MSGKCDEASHRPESNRSWASSACPHTCEKPDHCGHSWTLRHWVGGKQAEKSFRDKKNPPSGRVDPSVWHADNGLEAAARLLEETADRILRSEFEPVLCLEATDLVELPGALVRPGTL